MRSPFSCEASPIIVITTTAIIALTSTIPDHHHHTIIIIIIIMLVLIQNNSASTALKAAFATAARDKVAGLEAENRASQEKVAVLEAHLDQLIAQVQHADKGQSLHAEVERLRATLESERASAESEAAAAEERLREMEQQLDTLGAELLDARAAAREQVHTPGTMAQQAAIWSRCDDAWCVWRVTGRRPPSMLFMTCGHAFLSMRARTRQP